MLSFAISKGLSSQSTTDLLCLYSFSYIPSVLQAKHHFYKKLVHAISYYPCHQFPGNWHTGYGSILFLGLLAQHSPSSCHPNRYSDSIVDEIIHVVHHSFIKCCQFLDRVALEGIRAFFDLAVTISIVTSMSSHLACTLSFLNYFNHSVFSLCTTPYSICPSKIVGSPQQQV